MAAPTSLLRPFSSATDATYLPVLLRNAKLANIEASDRAVLLHPQTVALALGIIGVTLHYLRGLLFTVLKTPAESLFEDTHWTWHDNAALVIYALPPIAAVLGAFFGIAHWYHTRLWTSIADTGERRVDLLGVEGYYSKESGSAFWCLEYQNEIVVSLGVDGRHPGRQIRALTKDDLPHTHPSEPPPQADGGENEQDLALFRDANVQAAVVIPQPNLPDTIFDSVGNLPSIVSTSEGIDLASACQIRLFSISPSFRQTSEVDSYILDLAVHAALGTSSATPTRFEHVIITVDPILDKALRAAALNRGFRIAGQVALDSIVSDDEQGRATSMADRVAAGLAWIWPVSFQQEILVLDRQIWEKQKAKRG